LPTTETRSAGPRTIRRTSTWHVCWRTGAASTRLLRTTWKRCGAVAGGFKSDALNNLGLAYSNMELVAEAISAFRQAIRQNPQSAPPRVNLALGFLRHGNRLQGRRALEFAVRLRRVEPEATRWVAYALIEYDLDVRRGVGILERTLAQDPEDWGAMADLAVGYMKLGNYAKARVLATKARRRAPEDRDVKKQVAGVLGRPRRRSRIFCRPCRPA
jgi:tetratricopeptide (TPR) repeat protein